MKRQSDDAVSQEKELVEEEAEETTADGAEAEKAEAEEAEHDPEEEFEDDFEHKSVYDDASDYKFLKSRSKSKSKSSHHSSSSHHHSSSGHSHHHSSGEHSHHHSLGEHTHHHSSGEESGEEAAEDTLRFSTKSRSSNRHRRHHHHHRKKKMKTWKKVLIIVGCVILGLALTVCTTLQILYLNGRSDFFDVNLNVVVPESVEAEVQDNGDYIMYKGATYQYNHDVTNILFMGVDKRSMDDENEQGTGGQSDAIVMIAMNVKDHKMTLIALPRDTITDVALYSPSGHYSGMREMQVCMAYAYGDGKKISCENTVASVRRIFYNVPIKTYYALDLDGIAEVNDSVGGVDVVSPETIGPFTDGESYHLEGKQSENFVRLRDKSDIQSSMKRLERQKVYANSFMSTMAKKIKSDLTSAVSVYNESAPYSCTNLNAAKVTYLASEFAFGGGMSTEILTVPGELTYDNQYARFNIDEEKFFEQFLSVYYERM